MLMAAGALPQAPTETAAALNSMLLPYLPLLLEVVLLEPGQQPLAAAVALGQGARKVAYKRQAASEAPAACCRGLAIAPALKAR
jgi:hypothetical protein